MRDLLSPVVRGRRIRRRRSKRRTGRDENLVIVPAVGNVGSAPERVRGKVRGRVRGWIRCIISEKSEHGIDTKEMRAGLSRSVQAGPTQDQRTSRP